MKDASIMKAQLARALGCARSRITQLVARGMPCRTDGRLNRRQALAWISRNTSGSGGGWGAGRRGLDLQQRATALLAGGSLKVVPKQQRTLMPEVSPAGETNEILLALETAAHALLDKIRNEVYPALAELTLWLADRLRKSGGSAPMVGAMLARDVVEAILLTADDLVPNYPWQATPEPDYEALAAAHGLTITPEVRAHVDRLVDELSDWFALQGLWGPEAKAHTEAEQKAAGQDEAAGHAVGTE